MYYKNGLQMEAVFIYGNLDFHSRTGNALFSRGFYICILNQPLQPVTTTMKLSHWISAARFRTLPLALSGIILGAILAAANGQGSWLIFLLCVFTAILFQVLSNFANDLGDGIRGTDNNRIGETRMVGSGSITPRTMKKAVVLLAVLGIISAVTVSYIALKDMPAQWIYIYLGLGVLAILAAMGYTLGRIPYGYMRLGEVMVFLFFGWLAVAGTHTLITQEWNPNILWPASAVGLFSAGVLNLNNMRDIKNDLASNKKTLANAMGFRFARIFHYLLILLAIDCLFIYNWLSNTGWTRNLFFLAFPLLFSHILKVSRLRQPEDADPLLKGLALTTLVVSLLFGLGHYFN
jgi:1,4-dihydroxy-2-naphthoate polyprenyltransferase